MSTPLANDNTQIQLYINNLSLLHNLANYQSQMMYSRFPLHQKPGVLTELGKWFGLNYVYLSGTPLEPHDFWTQDPNWIRIPPVSSASASKDQQENINEGWREFTQATGDTTWDTRPKMLVVADNSRHFYDETFKFFTRGALLYEDGIPVLGKKNIDEYSLDELKQYDSIFMRSYGYKWQWNAYRLLDDYVKNGGNLIFDTGWQYNVPDYQLAKAPSFMPFGSLTWQNLDPDARLTVEDPVIAGDIDSSQLGDLKYGTASWGVSVPANLKSWAKPVVSADGKPLIVAGKYEKGKVIWIGFNIVAHAETKDSVEEAKLFRDLVSYVHEGRPTRTTYAVQKERISPDSVAFSLNQSVSTPSQLYFREAYYPDWRASLVSSNGNKNLTIQRAGPGFMLISLPPVTSGDKLLLEIKPSVGQIIATIVSIITFAGIVIYLFIPQIFVWVGSLFKRKMSGLKTHAKAKIVLPKGVTHKMRSTILGKEEDDDY